MRIPEDAQVRLLRQVTEEMDFKALYRAYSRKGRITASSPKHLFRIMVYGYMKKIYSSRALERACKEDIGFMWLLEGTRAPDHNTIARFRRERLEGVMQELFAQLVQRLHARGEIGFENLFADGTKIEANANRYTFVWKKAVNKHAAKLADKLSEQVRQLGEKYGVGACPSPYDVLHALKAQMRQQGFAWVSGRGHRKSEIQREVELLDSYLTRQVKYEGYGEVFRDRNSFSKTDPDATFMRMKDDHMRNGQLKPGYNLQIAVEGEYIVGLDISSERSDSNTLIPLLERMKQSLGRQHQAVTADAGYESEENYTYLAQQGQQCFIKPNNYERMKKRKYRSDMHLRENMPYDADQDAYLCPAGQCLRACGTRRRRSKSGYEAELTLYSCESCQDCTLKSHCTRAKGNRTMQISKQFIIQRANSLKNITSEQGILLRMNRSIQVEGAFGVIKEDYAFRRFLLRGAQNVRTEALLLCFGYNVNKLHSKTKQGRLGMFLHQRLIS